MRPGSTLAPILFLVLIAATSRAQDPASPPDAAAWRALAQDADAWIPVALPVRGAVALALGVKAGPRVGTLMKAVEQWWEEGDYRADRAACLKQLKRLVSES